RLLVFGIDRFAGLDNYRFLAEDPRFWNALGNTAVFTGVSVAVEFALGLGIALLLSEMKTGRGWMRAIVLVPWAIPTVVSARMWAWMYNPDFGVLNYLLGARVNWLGSPRWAMGAAIAMDAWKTTPFVALLLVAAIETVPPDLRRAAAVDGAGPWTILRRITLPTIAPMMLVAAVLRALDAFRVFDAIYVLTGGGPANQTETLSIYAYKVLFQTLQFGYGSTIAFATFCILGTVALAGGVALRRRWA
ncbi:MAG: sugar ABC transporter permease, partial [Myxococcales bacterium]|nr:sugar ABC transporter permease [Myxococcales bacterium]